MSAKRIWEWIERDTARMEAEQKQISARREEKTEPTWTDWLIGGPIVLILFLILATIGSAMFGAI